MNNIILSHSAKSLSNTFGFYDQLDMDDLIERAHRMDWGLLRVYSDIRVASGYGEI